MPRLRRAWKRVAPVVVGLTGAWVALLALGRTGYDIGPLRVELDLRPGPGVTEISLPPLGRVRANTHPAPLLLTARVDELEAERAGDLLSRGDTEQVARSVEASALVAARRHAWRSLFVAMAGAVALSLVVFGKRQRELLVAAGSTLGALALLAAGTWLGYRPDAFAEPSFTGSLRLAPRLLGPIRDAPGRIDAFRSEVERIVRGASRAYGVIAEEPPSAARVVALHISDVHASTVGMDVAQELAQTFDVDLVIDTGDITSFNTTPERQVLARIPGFRVPYLFVRGNHDSPGTAALVEAHPNGTVLDGRVVEIEGLRVYGAADPEFTPAQPDRASDEARAELLRDRGQSLRRALEVLDPPAHVFAVHDDRLAGPAAGNVPIVVSGHFHRAEQRARAGTIYLRAGTTGAGGFDPFPSGIAKRHSAQILYFDGSPLRLVALDIVELDPETRELTVRRTLASSIERDEPVQGPTPTP